MFEGFVRFANTAMKNRARRQTQVMLDSLPRSIQKDIGWRWSPDRPSTSSGSRIGWEYI
ncbi:hypothetical protein [Oryzicola mucosus]|uniref:Uncharacterized protein n=1 Tax=Oryzicola mucosus TaxID=2767425 RepID=A0A8J6PVU3_9HYPH|nr:hypothetical protein [Oryzicola mucosus]MBD0414953.1 hypothetical protein [Oryzicola mucosus]